MTRPPGYPSIDVDAIRESLSAAGVKPQPYAVDAAGFARYLHEAAYPDAYRTTFGPLFPEKALEHYVSLQFLRGGVGALIDVASCTSPFPDIARRLGAAGYRQDLAYPPGVHGDRIGGPGEAIPLPDASVGALTLHCAFEHFEGDADTGLVHEAARLLRPGGQVCILPLYLADRFSNVTDPAENQGVTWDTGAEVREVPGWRNRFGRFYDVAALRARVIESCGAFDVALYEVENATDIDPLCYLRWVLVLTRR